MDKYKRFVEEPTLELLCQWLLENEIVCIPRENDSPPSPTQKNEVTSNAWLRFFVPHNDLSELNRLGWMTYYDDLPSQIMRGTVITDYKTYVDDLKVLLQEGAAQIRADIRAHIADLLDDSDYMSRKYEKPEVRKQHRQEEMQRIFANDIFRKQCFDIFDWPVWEGEHADGIAVLIVIALWNLKCQGDSPEWVTEYFLVKMPDGSPKVLPRLEHLHESYNMYNSKRDYLEFSPAHDKNVDTDSYLYSKEVEENYYFGKDIDDLDDLNFNNDDSKLDIRKR